MAKHKTRIKSDAMHTIMPYLMNKRTEAEVYQNIKLDVTELKEWVDKYNEKLDFKLTYFHAFAAVLAKTIYNRPLLNRFIQGRKLYERKDLTISFVAKDKMSDDAEEKLIVLKINPKENALELGRRMAIDIFKTRKEGTNDMDIALKTLASLPRCLLMIVEKIIKILDFYDLLPKSFTKGDSNYSTLLLSNLGSIKCDSCYHHLNNYGTNSIMITIGTIKKEKNRYIVDLGATLDERIADGFYFAKSIKLAQEMISNPTCLEEELSSIYTTEKEAN